MTRFIKKLFLYIIVVIPVPGLILYILISCYPAHFLGDATNYYICKFQYGRIDSANYKNIIIGDSRGNASVAPKTLGNDWINLSIPGTDFFEGFYTLKHYLPTVTPDTLIMVYGLDHIENGSPFFNEQTIPFQFITPKELHSLELVERRFGYAYHDKSVVGATRLFTYQIGRRLRYDHFPLSYRATFIDGLTSLLHPDPSAEKRFGEIETQLREDRGHLHFGTADSSNMLSIADTARSFSPRPINLVYLDSIMAIVKKYNIQTYMIIPPMNQASWLKYKNSTFSRSVDEFLNSLTEKYPQMHLITEPRYLDNTFFGDMLHLNARGTILYSTELRRHLSAKGKGN